MADALASGASVLRDVGVQVPLRPPGAVLRTAGVKVTNSKEGVTLVFDETLIGTGLMGGGGGSPFFEPQGARTFVCPSVSALTHRTVVTSQGYLREENEIND
jgi:hypothetical protein